MRRFQALLLILALLVCSVPAAAAAAGPNGEIMLGLDEGGTGRYEDATVQVVQIALNGVLLESDVPAFIRGGRTMVPVRLITEKMGAAVQWFGDTNEVASTLGETTVKLKIGSAQAQVNGSTETLYDGIPAMIAKYNGVERTMVPLRFVSEQLGAQVEWMQDTYTVSISAEQGACVVKSIEADANTDTVHIITSEIPNYVVTDMGDRVVLDLLETKLASGAFGTIQVDNEYISNVRYAQHGGDLYSICSSVVRIVLDLKEGITLQDNMELTPLANGLLLTTFPVGGENTDCTPTTPIDPAQKTVVLDAGHGGGDAGALYEGIREKDINLAVAKKVEAILLSYGYHVVMTRTEDTTVDLYTRADIANEVNADIFVSIHSNAAEKNTDFTGIYTYYHPTSRRGARLAQAIQTPLCELTGGIDRGIESADFVVLRETSMCAALVEMGFMTNSGELQLLISPSYQDKLAAGIAEGIVSYLNNE